MRAKANPAFFLVSFVLASGLAFAQTDSSSAPSAAVPTTDADQKAIQAAPAPATDQQQFQQSIKDVHFDFDRSELRDQDRSILAGDAEWLKAHPDVIVTLEGDADERGDVVYNLALSGERATVARDALVQLGVPSDRIVFATGWGKLYPVCSESDENCWSQNRRTHIAIWPPVDEPAQVAVR